MCCKRNGRKFCKKQGQMEYIYSMMTIRNRIDQMNKRILKRWDKLLDIYFNDSSVSEEWRARVGRWLAEEVFEEEKDAALEKYFNLMMQNER